MKIKKIILCVYYKLLNKYNEFLALSKKKPLVKNSEETLDKIINDRCSVSRYGDGELGIIYGNSIGFQRYDEELRLRLKEIIVSNHKNHIVCIPDVFDSIDRFEENAKKFWEEYLSFVEVEYIRLLI